ncbi:hypothetical protein [Ralstonia pseudosolanacearum]|uniref:hypothetical protein n=1 Tax=Ralstonia pseudosolanacearum TaxID=1310165 RepID=UPI0018D12B61|nr:hypothetical protein [Ralstonia pseudosolanacearum]
MSIRANNNTKNRSSQYRDAESGVMECPPSAHAELDDPLQFFTLHPTKPCFVDLRPFRDGEARPPKRNGDQLGTFRGRPALIAELAPAIHDQIIPLAERSVIQTLGAVRAWWRIFDAVEADPEAPIVASVADLSDLHRQVALDSGMYRETFSLFLGLANITRTALGLRRLHWDSPARRDSKRRLPPQWQTDLVRHKLKHRWLAVVERWTLADALRRQAAPLVNRDTEKNAYEGQARLLRNYQRFDAVVARTGHPRPSQEQLYDGQSRNTFYYHGYSVVDMMLGSYPDGDDIRAAFHLCLATTGWNAAVLLSLDVNESFLESHPKDPSRYVLRGKKARAGGAEQVTEGLFKTRGGAGFILRTLMERTAPLRAQLNRELLECQVSLQSGIGDQDNTTATRKRLIELQQAVRSPWLHVSKIGSGIQWLHDENFYGSLEKLTNTYLGDFITNINNKRDEGQKVSLFTASDFRDAYAAHVYRASGGSILAVMRALGHRHVSSTSIYLNNSLLKEEHRKLFSTFSFALWDESITEGKIDPTILAHWSRYGEVTPEHKRRLHSYRGLLISRIGIGCKNPQQPPKHIAPGFVGDGKSMCPVQRCTLCTENAVILPESLSGLCKRLAELRYLRTSMGLGAFLESSFPKELDNTELALLAFDSLAVENNLNDWEERIASKTHRVIEFDGTEKFQ